MEDESRDEEETVAEGGEDDHGKEKPWYPYITKTQFEKFISRLQSEIPDEIDRDYVRAIIRTPSMIYRFLRGVEAMGLIDEEQRPTERLLRLVNKETREQALTEVVHDLYPILMTRVKEAGGEMPDRDIVAFFRKETGMGNDSANKMKMFFSYLLSEAGGGAADAPPSTTAEADSSDDDASDDDANSDDGDVDTAQVDDSDGDDADGQDDSDDGDNDGNRADPPEAEPASSRPDDKSRGGQAERRSQRERSGGNAERSGGNAERSGNADRSGNTERSGGNAERSGNADRSGNTDRSGNADRGGNAERSGNADRSGNAEPSSNAERSGGNDRGSRGGGGGGGGGGGEREEREERGDRDRGGRSGRGGRDRGGRNERTERVERPEREEREAERVPNNRPLTEPQRAYLDTLKSVLRVNVDGDWDDDMIRLAFDRLERLFDRIRRG